MGNRTSETVRQSGLLGTSDVTTASSFNPAHQLTSRGSVTYSYDANGNQAASSAGQALAYNPADQTTSLKRAGGARCPLRRAEPGGAHFRRVDHFHQRPAGRHRRHRHGGNAGTKGTSHHALTVGDLLVERGKEWDSTSCKHSTSAPPALTTAAEGQVAVAVVGDHVDQHGRSLHRAGSSGHTLAMMHLTRSSARPTRTIPSRLG
jgi:hypothetical protein